MRSAEKKRTDLWNWHRWFAWRPVRVYSTGGPFYRVAWLETVERQIAAGSDGLIPISWIYRFCPNQGP